MSLFDFGKKEDGKYDVVLRVDGREFYVMRERLGTYSPELHNQLCGDGNNVDKDQVLELEGVTADGVQVVLELINGCNRINDESIEKAVQCSRKWEARLPLRACEEYLMEKSELDKKTMFGLADKYKLLALKAQLIEGITEKTTLESILPDNLQHLQHDSLVLILQKARVLLRDSVTARAPVRGVPLGDLPVLAPAAARNVDPVAVNLAQIAQVMALLRRHREALPPVPEQPELRLQDQQALEPVQQRVRQQAEHQLLQEDLQPVLQNYQARRAQQQEEQLAQQLAQAQQRTQQLDQQLEQAYAELQVRERVLHVAVEAFWGPDGNALRPGYEQAFQQQLDRRIERNLQEVQVQTHQRALREAERHVQELTRQLAQLRAQQRDPMQMAQGHNGQGDMRPQMGQDHGGLPPRDVQQ